MSLLKNQKKHGRLFIVSAPSGAGKTTLCKVVLNKFKDMVFSVSCTTRKPRSKEQNSVDYYFISQNDFKKKLQNNQWAEWAEVHGNFYGTSSEFLNKTLSSGKNVLLDIDIQGAAQIIKQYPNDSVTIFIMPPSLDVLKNRLKRRGSDNDEAIEKRLLDAEKEIAQKDFYHYIIVNDQLSESIEKLISIIEKHGAKN